MDKRVKISVVNSVVSLDFSFAGIEDDAILDRVSEIAPILEAAINADISKLLVDDSRYEELLPLVLAKDLTYQAYLHKAMFEISSIIDVLAGRLSASQMGYPEFGGGFGSDD